MDKRGLVVEYRGPRNVETKKEAYLKLMENKDEEEKRTNKKSYKTANKEAKLV